MDGTGGGGVGAAAGRGGGRVWAEVCPEFAWGLR